MLDCLAKCFGKVSEQVDSTLPIIALTGYGRAQDRKEAQLAGIDSLLTRPVDLVDLEDALPAPTGEDTLR